MCDYVREASAGFAKTAEEQDELVEATRFWLLLRRLVLMARESFGARR
jgi:hypothetical protein